MQQRLFGPALQGLTPVSDVELERVLRELRAASELDFLRMWLVGSRLEPGRTGSDVDLVLSPRGRRWPSDHFIERALWHCRDYGLHGTTHPVVVDPCFRAAGPTLTLIALRPHVSVRTVKLLSPRLAGMVKRGAIAEYRCVGDLGIEFVRRAADTDYFRKLPRADFAGSWRPYLRPAVEILPAESSDLPHGVIAQKPLIDGRVARTGRLVHAPAFGGACDSMEQAVIASDGAHLRERRAG